MEAIQLALILIVVVACVTAATVPATSHRASRRASRRLRRGIPGDKAKPVAARGLPTQRNRWDRPDLDRAIGRFDDEGDGALTVWPGGA